MHTICLGTPSSERPFDFKVWEMLSRERWGADVNKTSASPLRGSGRERTA